MRLPRARFTVRRMMLAVAIVGLTLGAFGESRRLTRKAAEHRAKAAEHAAIEQTLRGIIEKDGPDAPIDISPGPGIRSVRFTARAVAEFEAALSRKYERASRHPWLTPEPDQPMPEPR